MRFVLAGASGFLGTRWRDQLAREGHEVVRLVRGEAASASESHWDPSSGQVDAAVIESADVVACLSGAPLFRVPMTASYRETVMASRVDTTGTLARAVAASARRPVLVAQNGVAGYGDRGDRPITEDVPTDADTFAAEVTRRWETAAQPAVDAGARVVVLRTAVVLGRGGGPLKPLVPVYRLGLGGPIGPGTQYFATVSATDWVRAATFLALREQSTGAYNLSAPEPVTNAEFGRLLARRLHRPAVVPAPAFAVRLALGPVAPELLNSARVVPHRLLEEGFDFTAPTLTEQLEAELG